MQFHVIFWLQISDWIIEFIDSNIVAATMLHIKTNKKQIVFSVVCKDAQRVTKPMAS